MQFPNSDTDMLTKKTNESNGAPLLNVNMNLMPLCIPKDLCNDTRSLQALLSIYCQYVHYNMQNFIPSFCSSFALFDLSCTFSVSQGKHSDAHSSYLVPEKLSAGFYGTSVSECVSVVKQENV